MARPCSNATSKEIGMSKHLPPEDRDLDFEIDQALDRVADIIRAYPTEIHGDMCIGAYRHLQMAVRPATEPGLWDRPARPSRRVLLPDGSGNVASLDEQLRDFAGVVASMILDYPKELHANICRQFLDELRANFAKAAHE
jgi:hypothetical protein